MIDEQENGSATVADSGPSPADSAAPSPAPPSTTDDTAAPSPATDVTAEPSPATGVKDKETLLEHVLTNFKPEGKNADAKPLKPSEPPVADTPAPIEVADEDILRDPTPEELRRYNSKTRERIQHLIAQRDGYKADAEIGGGLKEFLTGNDIAKEDFLLTLDLAAAMRRGDFQGFLAGVGPYVQLALEATGQLLPKDLQQRVSEGHMTSVAAADYSRQRYAAQMAAENAQRSQQALTSQRNEYQSQQLRQACENAVGVWESNARRSDPDFEAKQDAVTDTLYAVMQQVGEPTTPEQAVRVAQEAYRRVNQHFARFRPPPRPTQSSPSSIARSGNGALPEPKTMLEAVQQGLEKARRHA